MGVTPSVRGGRRSIKGKTVNPSPGRSGIRWRSSEVAGTMRFTPRPTRVFGQETQPTPAFRGESSKATLFNPYRFGGYLGYGVARESCSGGDSRSRLSRWAPNSIQLSGTLVCRRCGCSGAGSTVRTPGLDDFSAIPHVSHSEGGFLVEDVVAFSRRALGTTLESVASCHYHGLAERLTAATIFAH